jgi:hypothetical protein
MKFVDYTITRTFDDNIIFDEDLKPEQLGVKPGDCFEVKIRDNKIILEKMYYNE